ncbi:MAG TPA: hypothetical protein VF744_00690 [Beijerinckiaceae bacterium]
MSPWRRDIGRKVIGGTHIFVLRMSLEPGDEERVVTRLRLETVESGEMKHFSEIDAAVDHLRDRLRGLAGVDGGPR